MSTDSFIVFNNLERDSFAAKSADTASETINKTSIDCPLSEAQLNNLQRLRDISDFFAETNKLLLEIPKNLTMLKAMTKEESVIPSTGTDDSPDIGSKIQNLLVMEVEYRAMKATNEALRDIVEKMKKIKEGEEWMNMESEYERFMHIVGEENKGNVVRDNNPKFVNDLGFCIIS